MRSERYLKHVRGRPCCWCSAPAPSDPHHFGPRGTAIKASDLFTVPLCRACHDHWHRAGRLQGCATAAESRAQFHKAALQTLALWVEQEAGRE